MSLTLLETGAPQTLSQSTSMRLASKAGWVNTLKWNRTDTNLGINLDDIDPFSHDGRDAWETLSNIAALGWTLGDNDEKPTRSTAPPKFSLHGDDARPEHPATPSPRVRPFHKWMKNLHRRAHRPRTRHGHSRAEPFPEFPEVSFADDVLSPDCHRKSSSGSSFGFVAAVRSASVSLASASVMTRSRRHTARSSRRGKTDSSSRGSTCAPRESEDSTCLERISTNDTGVTERLLQRRHILEELINTEEGYIGDVKFLMNVYVTILASLPSSHLGLRSSINRNLTDIVELHEEILGDLHRAVPNSEYTQPECIPKISNPPSAKEHHHWHSLDSVPEGKGGAPLSLRDIPSVIAEPNVAAEVAHVFGKRINRFFIYEEYGAKYEMMIKDVASTHRTLPQWETYQKGLEALGASLSSANHHLENSKKSLTIGDLLVKPIQRICRYPLLFAELLKYTPVCDCPNSHMEIENVLIRLREATAEINRATDDPGMKISMEQTWLLQDRLMFPNKQKLDAASKSTIRSFGQVRLCGALHVCWQTKDSVNGAYMVILLYKDCLCLAKANRADHVYTIQACLSLDDINIEEVDNGRGLQCHTAPFSWKLVFESDHQLYEFVMTACSQKEELEWRTRLARHHSTKPPEFLKPTFYSAVFLDMRSLGTIFGKPGTVARRLSIQRATTVGPRSPLCQVILKNTSVVKDTSAEASGSQINRSQSFMTTNARIPVLAPSRGDRARLEALLADVWSRKVLPFPGMTTRSRSEHLVRSSASTVMRKLSVASIANSFTKRPTSATGAVKPSEDEYPHVDSFVDGLVQLNCNESSSELVGAGTAEGDAKKRLPVIRDEIEHSLSPTNSSLAGSCADSGTVKRSDSSRLELKWLGEEHGFNTPGLHTSLSNSIRRSRRRLSAGSSPSSNTDDENVGQRRGTKHHSQEKSASVGAARKWRRVGAIRKASMASSIRSLFRQERTVSALNSK
ncbi:Dbl homology domain-containing protein [Durotheca rogersii]|uniref:Dbl homology domain-containing protein n=1 Tax=Durotheca rogersii TaxID=419775 RepID=UPI0022209FD8|nr:Dbl homology domain-containing protein [Durotheca rogersii]KAI5866921.1 Dbl homology domain-containing protein [Durotheca rogersii]